MGIIQSAVNKSIGTVGTLASLKKLSDQPNLEEQVKKIKAEKPKGKKGKEEYLKKNIYANTQLERSMLKQGNISGAYEAQSNAQSFGKELEELKKRREKAQLKAFAKKQEKSTQQAESDAFKKLFMEGVPLTMRAKKES